MGRVTDKKACDVQSFAPVTVTGLPLEILSITAVNAIREENTFS